MELSIDGVASQDKSQKSAKILSWASWSAESALIEFYIFQLRSIIKLIL